MKIFIPILVLTTRFAAENVNTGLEVFKMLLENTKAIETLDENALEAAPTFIDRDISEICPGHDYYHYIHRNVRLSHHNLPENIAVVFRGNFYHGRVINGRHHQYFQTDQVVLLDPRKDYNVEISSQHAFHLNLKVLSYCFNHDYPEKIFLVIKDRSLKQIVLREQIETLAAKPSGSCYGSLCEDWKIDLELDKESRTVYDSAVATLRYNEEQLPLYRQLVQILGKKHHNIKTMKSHPRNSHSYQNLVAKEKQLDREEFSIYEKIIEKSVQDVVAYKKHTFRQKIMDHPELLKNVSKEIIRDLLEFIETGQ